MDERKYSPKQENASSDPINSEETLKKLALLEEKLRKLQDFNEQSFKIRETRKKLVQNLIDLDNTNKDNLTTVKEKRVKFSVEGVHGRRLKRIPSKREFSSYTEKMNRSKSIHDLLFNLHHWHGEIKRRKSEIEMLKAKKMSIREERNLELDNKIIQLENEKDELDEKVLHFVLQNIDDNKEDYKELITILEMENRDMEDRMDVLKKRVDFLKEINIGLTYENEELRRAACRSTSSVVLALENKYRENIMIKANNSGSFCCNMQKTESKEFSMDMKKDDESSLNRKSFDSFELDKQISTWKTDEESLQKCLARLAEDFHDMNITQMKLNTVKQHVQQHGTKNINRHTFLDNTSHKMSF